MPHDNQAACTACGEPARRDPFYYAWHGREWWIHRCPRCTHQFVWPVISDEDRAAIFSDAYFAEDGDWVCGVWQTSYENAEPQLRHEAREVLALLGPANGRLLDIGCAGGTFLDEARSTGWDVAGVEFNETMARRTADLGIPVVQGAIEQVPLDAFDQPFDAVVLMDTLEHVSYPRPVMERVRAWTGPSARLLIRGPLQNDPIARLKETVRRLAGRPKQLPGYPLDANTWNRRSLTRLVETFGFEVEGWHGLARGFGTLTARRRP